jgi:glyoxylase-like metal-dependent hydrolase (beta-lactamase superfamily II)
MTTVGITVDELRERLAQHQPVTILDVRPGNERAEWSIPGSRHIDAYDRLWAGDEHSLDEFEAQDDAPVITVCAAGRTSLIAALQLRKRGIDARSLSGGMKAWSLAWNSAEIPLPTSMTEVIQVRRTGKGCLSYLIGSAGQAAVLDASLPPEVYQQLAQRYGWSITHVFDTHVHADHLSRARALAEAAGATLYLPAQDRVDYPFVPLHDGDVITIGTATILVLHTPGHTLESMSYLVDRQALFTGDTLFLNGVGRPDLEASPEQASERAHLLYRSLQWLTALPAGTLVLPGHTSQPVAFDHDPVVATMDEVVARVDLLQSDEQEFVTSILGRIPPTPPNHHLIVQLNEAGLLPESSDIVELEAGANRCAVS